MNRSTWCALLLGLFTACGQTSCPGLHPVVSDTVPVATAAPTDLAQGRFVGLTLGTPIDSCVAVFGEPQDQYGGRGEPTFTYAYYDQGVSVAFSSATRRIVSIAIHVRPNALIKGSERFRETPSPFTWESLSTYPNRRSGLICRYELSRGHIDVLYAPDERSIWLIALVAPAEEVAPPLAALAAPPPTVEPEIQITDGPDVTDQPVDTLSSTLAPGDLPPLPRPYARRLLFKLPGLPIRFNGSQTFVYPPHGRVQESGGCIRVVFEIVPGAHPRRQQFFAIQKRVPGASDYLRGGFYEGGTILLETELNINAHAQDCIVSRTVFVSGHRYTVDFVWGRQGIAIYVDGKLDVQGKVGCEKLSLLTDESYARASSGAGSGEDGGQGFFIGQENNGAMRLDGVTVYAYEVYGAGG